MKSAYVNAYHTIFEYSYWIVLGSLVGNSVGDFFSAVLVPKFKVIFNGKFTKSIIFIIHIISELLTISISYTIINLADGYTFNQITHLVFGTMVYKSIIAMLMLPLAKRLIDFIKSNEGIDIYDQNQDCKLFKFSLDLNKIKFVNWIGIYNGRKDLHN